MPRSVWLPAEKRPKEYKINVLAYQLNVLTLNEPVHQAPTPGLCAGADAKILYLDRQFSERGAVIIAMEETCTSGPDYRVLPGYISVSSGADKQPGRLGCELWVARQITITHSGVEKIISLDIKDIILCCYSPRILYATIRAPPICWDVMITHAPQSAATLTCKTEFWQLAEKVATENKTPDTTLFLFTDSNSKIGSVKSGSIGSFHADT